MGEIDLHSLVGVDHGDRLLEGSHHPESEEVDLDQPEVGAVVLVPLDHCPVLHCRRLQRHHLVKPALGYDHAARMLAEVAGKVVDLPPQPLEVLDPAGRGVETNCGQFAVEIACPLGDLDGHMAAEAFGDAAHLFERETQCLADLARCRTRAVGDHVGGHRGAVRTVALIHVLDDSLTLIAGWQVEIDVRPFAALLGQKALEEQFHLDRVDGGDREGIADRRVGGRTSALGHDLFALTEANDVPNDQEIARQVEFFDQVELLLELRLGTRSQWAEAGAGPIPGHPSQVGDGTFAYRQGVVGEAVAEVIEGELEFLREVSGCGHSPLLIGEEHLHLALRAQVALATTFEEASRGIEGETLADAGKDIGEVTVLRPCVTDPAGRHQRQPQATCKVDTCPIAMFLGAQAVALELDVEPVWEEMMKMFELAFGGLQTAVEQALGEDSLGTAGETEETVGVGLDLAPAGTGLSLGPAACGLGQ